MTDDQIGFTLAGMLLGAVIAFCITHSATGNAYEHEAVGYGFATYDTNGHWHWKQP